MDNLPINYTLDEIFNCSAGNQAGFNAMLESGLKESISEKSIEEKASRFNEGKPKWSLVHFESLVPMIRVLEFGAKKYAPKNWMKPMNADEILESMQRHLAALFDGEVYDKESGVSHMGHIQCNAMFYNYHKAKENGAQSKS